MKKVPFSFKFDETTTSQVKKQYDVYLSYWSKSADKVVSSYAGTLFVGHCTASDLVSHYNTMVEKLQLDSSHLLHLGMDGPKVNLTFQKKLAELLHEEGTEFMDLGTCSLHPVHTAFRKGLSQLSFPFESFFHDLHFFSSCRLEGGKITLLCQQ